MIKIDLERKEVRILGKAIPATPKEFLLLATLAQADGKVMSREQLASLVWGVEVRLHSRTVDQHIARLRFKLGNESSAIVTSATFGYKVNPGSVVIVGAPKIPAAEISSISRFFKDGRPAYKMVIWSFGETSRKKGEKVRVCA